MAIDFPNSPTTGDTYTAGGRTWQWDGTVWAAYGNYPDPTVLKIDTGTNRVGINNTSPTTALDVTGDLTVSGKIDAPLPVSNKTASYTLAAGDEGTRIVMNNAGATTITVDDGVFSAGDTVWIHNIGAGTCTVTAGTATVNTAGSLDVGQWEGGSLYFTSASSAIFFRGGGAVSYGAATGGTSSSITVGGESYTLLEFTSSGTLTVTKAGVFDLLIVGGGGGGVNSTIYCGGGGAGGVMYVDKVYFDANQTVTIGAGGALRTFGSGSVVGGIIAPTGSTGRSNYQERGGGHGSGGGGGYSLGTGSPGDGVTGNDGGAYGGGGAAGGGGGGAGAAGSPSSASSAIGGAGGAGADVSAWRGEAATTTYYAGGGGGSSSTNNIAGGIGGGGYGEATNGLQAGGTNTGGGGGSRQSSGTAGAGGSGIVLVRFKN